MSGWRPWLRSCSRTVDHCLKKTTLYSSNGVSTPTQWPDLQQCNLIGLIIDHNLNEYRRRRDLLLSGLNEIGLTCENPAGAFYAFPDVMPYQVATAEKLY
jgi:aspartate aminotransferase